MIESFWIFLLLHPVSQNELHFITHPFGWGCRICRLRPRSCVWPPSNECPGYDTKQLDREVLILWLWRMLLSAQICLGVAVLLRVQYVTPLKIFTHSLYLKPSNSMQTNDTCSIINVRLNYMTVWTDELWLV